MIFAHQYLYQLDNISRNLKASVMANTGIKIMGKLEHADAKFMSDRMGVKPERFFKLKKKDRKYTQYLFWIKDVTDEAVKVKIRLGKVNRKKRMSQNSFELLRQKMREKYCVKTEPEQGQTEAPKKLPPRPKLI